MKGTATLFYIGYTCRQAGPAQVSLPASDRSAIMMQRLSLTRRFCGVMNKWHPMAGLILGLALMGCALPASAPEGGERLQRLHDRAVAGDLESQYQLGMHYTTDGRWPWDRMRGYRWFVDAAAGGHAGAEYMVGMAKLLGRGTLPDQDGAVHAFEKAAVHGHVRSQYQLGLAYLHGNGVAKDQAWGRQWLEQAAWAGHREAQFMLGVLFAGGVGGAEDRTEGWRWLELSRRAGQPQADEALNRLQGRMSLSERNAARTLLAQTPEVDLDRLYRNPRVRFVQARLNQLAYPAGPEDGLYGPVTRAAVDAFLRQHALSSGLPLAALAESLRESKR